MRKEPRISLIYHLPTNNPKWQGFIAYHYRFEASLNNLIFIFSLGNPPLLMYLAGQGYARLLVYKRRHLLNNGLITIESAHRLCREHPRGWSPPGFDKYLRQLSPFFIVVRIRRRIFSFVRRRIFSFVRRRIFSFVRLDSCGAFSPKVHFLIVLLFHLIVSIEFVT